MSRREFPAKVKLQAWDRCGGLCEGCQGRLMPGRFQYDHVIADGLLGDPTLSNCEVLCSVCHDLKTNTHDKPVIAKTKRLRRRAAGIRKPRTMTSWRRFDGSIVHAPRER